MGDGPRSTLLPDGRRNDQGCGASSNQREKRTGVKRVGGLRELRAFRARSVRLAGRIDASRRSAVAGLCGVAFLVNFQAPEKCTLPSSSALSMLASAVVRS